MPGGTTVTPPGLRRSDATLHTTFDVATPSEHDSEVAARTDVCTASGDPAGVAEVVDRRAEVEIPLVDAGSLDHRDDLANRRPDRLRVLAVEGMPWPQEDGVGAAPQRVRAAHRASDPELPGDVVGRRDDAATVRVAADDQRHRPQSRLLELLDCREERVEVQVGEDHVARLRSRRRTHRRRLRHDALWTVLLHRRCSSSPRRIRPPTASSPARSLRERSASSSVAGGRVLAEQPVAGRRFSLRVGLPARETSLRVVAVRRDGSRSATTVRHVLGLPVAARPRFRLARLDPILSARLRRLARAYGGTSSVYVQSLTSGAGAAWNARARFPAASTLKLAIAIAVLERHVGVPSPGSYVDGLLRAMLGWSDNASANALEVWLAGSTGAGSDRVVSLLRSIGLGDSVMYGGYEIERSHRCGDPAPRRRAAVLGRRQVLDRLRPRPDDACRLARVRRTRSAPPSRPRILGRRRPLPPLSARACPRRRQARPRGRRGCHGVRVLHKGGWIDQARHDNGLVFWRGGVYVVAVMTYRPAGTGPTEDVLAGRVAKIALERFRR